MSVARIELATTRLSGECSTTELYARYFWNGWVRTNAYSYQKQMPYHLATFHKYRSSMIRTYDLQNPNLTRYQATLCSVILSILHTKLYVE